MVSAVLRKKRRYATTISMAMARAPTLAAARMEGGVDGGDAGGGSPGDDITKMSRSARLRLLRPRRETDRQCERRATMVREVK